MNTVLIVDDNKGIRTFCRMELEAEGYRVLDARDGLEAIAMTEAHAPDIVVLDVRMPGINGLQAAACLGSRWPEMPLILYTAHHREYVRDLDSCRKLRCVEKSEDVTELKAAIATALRDRRADPANPLGPETLRGTHTAAAAAPSPRGAHTQVSNLKSSI